MTTDEGRSAPDLLAQEPGVDSNGFPLCDVCNKSAVWSEVHGWRHSTEEYKFDVPSNLDDSGHEVSAKRWGAMAPVWKHRLRGDVS